METIKEQLKSVGHSSKYVSNVKWSNSICKIGNELRPCLVSWVLFSF